MKHNEKKNKISKLSAVTICFGFLLSVLALGIFLYSYFIAADTVIKSQAIYWFYTSLFAAVLPFILANIKYFKYKDMEIGLAAKVDNLKKTTEEQYLKIITNSLNELSTTEYINQLFRILKKEKQRNNDICLIYADIDGLKAHITNKEDGRLLRVKILEFLGGILERTANRFEKPYDIYSLTLGEPDSIMIIRQMRKDVGVELAEFARRLFKKQSAHNDELELGKDEFLTVSISVASTEKVGKKVSLKETEILHQKTLKLLDKAKDAGKDRVES